VREKHYLKKLFNI